MSRTVAFIDFDGTMTKESGDAFFAVHGRVQGNPFGMSQEELLQQKLASGEFDDLLAADVITQLRNMAEANIEIVINSNNYRSFIIALLKRQGFNELDTLIAEGKIRIFGRTENRDYGQEDDDFNKIERFRNTAARAPGDQNFVYDDSSKVIHGCQAIASASTFHLTTIFKAAGAFNWGDENYLETMKKEAADEVVDEWGEEHKGHEGVKRFYSDPNETLATGFFTRTQSTTPPADGPPIGEYQGAFFKPVQQVTTAPPPKYRCCVIL